MRTKSLASEPEPPQLQSHRLTIEVVRVTKLEARHADAEKAVKAAGAMLRQGEGQASADRAAGREVSPVTLDGLRLALDQAVQEERIAREALELGREMLERKRQRGPTVEELRELQDQLEANFKLVRESMTTLMGAIDELFTLQPQARMKLGDLHPIRDLPWETLQVIADRSRHWLGSKNVSEARWRV